MAVELIGLAIANVAYFVVGAAAFVAGGWVKPASGVGWGRLGAAYLFGIALLIVPTTYLALLGIPVGLSAFAIGIVVVAAAVWRVGLRRRFTRPTFRRPSPEGIAAAAVTGVAVVLLAYSFRTFVVRPLVDFDAWAIWSLKARLLYQDPGAAPALLRSGRYGQSPYPLGFPTLQALGFGAMGRFDGTLIGAQLVGLAFGFVGGLWSLLERRARPLPIALAVAAVVAAPQMLFQLLTHYADVPLGLFVGLGVAAAAAWSVSPGDDNWLLACAVGFLAMAGLTKSEGLMFAAAAAASLVVVQVGPGWRSRVRPTLTAVGALAACLVPWQIYCSVYGLKTGDYDVGNVANIPYLRANSDRVGPVVRELWLQLHDTNHWGYLVAAVATAVATGLLGRRWRATAFTVVWLALGFVGLVLIYWVSTLPTSPNLTNSSFRTIVSLLIGGTALIPLLIAPTPGPSGTEDRR